MMNTTTTTDAGVRPSLNGLHASIADFVDQEIRPAILTDATITPERSSAIAAEVCTRLQAAGLVVWDDGWDERGQVHHLNLQGFRWADTGDDDGAALWGIVFDVLGASSCPRWCREDHLDADGATVHRLQTSADDAPFLVRVEQYPDAPPAIYVQDAQGDDLTGAQAMALADALIRAAVLIDGAES